MKEIESVNELVKILRKVELIEYIIERNQLPFKITRLVIDSKTVNDLQELKGRKIVDVNVPYDIIEHTSNGIVLSIN